MAHAGNLDVYQDHDVALQFAGMQGWIDNGEQAALLTAAPLVRAKHILDIGVGGGRTVGLLALLSDSYIGIDFSSAMVSTSRARYPQMDIRVGDARDLSTFEDHAFGFVMFSFNGIDTLDETGRRQALGEIHRVLEKEGIFVFSTLNRHGRSYNETPFQLHRPGDPWDRTPAAALRLIRRNIQDPRRFGRRCRNWLRSRKRCIDAESEGWALTTLSALDFLLLNHFVTIERLRRELQEASFEVIAIYESGFAEVRALPPEVRRSDTDYFHVVARKLAK